MSKKPNIFENIDFTPLCHDLTGAIKTAVEKYWEQDIKIILRALNDFRELREERLAQNLDFFSSQIKVDKHKPIIVRLSKNFIENFLGITLLENPKKFKLSELTPLEIKILNNFSEFLYKRTNEILLPVQNVKITEKSEKNINFLFLLCLKNGSNAEIMLSVPSDRIKFETLKKTVSFTDADFRNSAATVKIRAGRTKITLDELNNLTEDDIVVLENSNSSKLTLISGGLEKQFNVKVNPSLVLNLDEDEDGTTETYDEVIMEKNLWDDIQIEISAEFEKVKMTIGELKQITQGQIVDLGSVFDNEISLFVEDKKVAKGELIIINDRYAVRLNEVLSSKTTAAETEIKTQVNPPPKAQAANPQPAASKPNPAARAQQVNKPLPRPQAAQKPAPKPNVVEDEEFDYSDFEK